jgi:hypothetical protein
MVEMLLRAGAWTSVKDVYGFEPLKYASHNMRTRIQQFVNIDQDAAFAQMRMNTQCATQVSFFLLSVDH